MSKNLLSENMLRFGTKNLNEWQQRELIVKSIMETINQNGLHSEIRRNLISEQADPAQNATIGIWSYQVSYRVAKDAKGYTAKDTKDRDKVFIYQNKTSMSEAKQILGSLISVLKKDTDGSKTLAIMKKITTTNYPAILWRVRYGTSFKNTVGYNFSGLGNWLSKHFEAPADPGGNMEYWGGTDIIASAYYWITGAGDVGDQINAILSKFNTQDQIAGYSSGQAHLGSKAK